MEALLLDERWNPASRLVELNESFLDLSHFDEPAVEASVDERCLTAPAEGIAMVHSAVGKESSSRLQIGNDHLVSILDINAGVWFHDWQELSVLVDGHGSLARLDNATIYASSIIILTEPGSAVNNASTSVLRDEFSAEDLEAAVGSPFLEEGEQGLILLADESLTLECVEDGVVLDHCLLEDVLESVLHADVHLLCLVVLPANVVHGRVDGDCHIAGQGPRRRGPSNEVRLLTVVENGERDDDRGVGHVFVVGAGLKVR